MGRGNANAGGSYMAQGAQQFTIRGIGLYDTYQAGGAANSRASMAAFMDEVADLIEGAPVRTEMELVHAYIKA